MHHLRLAYATASSLIVAFCVALSACTAYGTDRYVGSAYHGDPYGYASAHGDSICGYRSIFRCGYYDGYPGDYHYAYTHLHNGWDDGFHGHFASVNDIHTPWPGHGLMHDRWRHSRDDLHHHHVGSRDPGSHDHWNIAHRNSRNELAGHGVPHAGGAPHWAPGHHAHKGASVHRR